MRILKTAAELKAFRRELPGEVGFVPTMGALHAAHASLLRRARNENDHVILSIFVNPTQFNNPDDLKNYPKTWDSDLAIAHAEGVDAIFAPTDPNEMYPDGYRYGIVEKEFSKELCGEFRPGHFDGMLTVVMKLLNLVWAERAYFGEKDYQQLSLIRGMVDAFFFHTEIVACPTLREKDGLAMSSRNLRLTADEREKAPYLHRALTTIADASKVRTALEENGFKVEYVVDREGRRFAAAWLGNVRLIDNVEKEARK